MWNAIQASPGGMVAAVGSRRTQRAATFIRECSRERPGVSEPLAIGDYQSLIEHPEVDVVYLPLPTAMRKRFVIDAARAGKHVLCEKPAAVNSNDLEEMVAECETAGVQFMDGVMFDHSIRWSAFLDAIHDPVKGLGAIRRIQTHFSFPGDAEFQAVLRPREITPSPHARTSSQLCLGELLETVSSRLQTEYLANLDSA